MKETILGLIVLFIVACAGSVWGYVIALSLCNHTKELIERIRNHKRS